MTMLGTRLPPSEHRPPIDPRIRQRRIDVTRQTGRRRLRILLAGAGLMLAVVLGDVILHSSWLSVSRVQVVGAHATPAGAVMAAAAPVLHHPMMSADTALVTGRVAALPWVDTVTVGRHWPSTLIVTVTERVPVALVAVGQQWAEVDGTGRVLAVVPGHTAGLVGLQVPAPSGAPGTTLPAPDLPAVMTAAQLRAQLAGGQPSAAGPDSGPGTPSVTSVTADADGNVSLALTGGVEADLGPATSLPDKLTALATVLSGVDLSGVKTIDLRVPERPVLTRG